MALSIDKELLKRFEEGVDPAHPEKSIIPARILGYGEISTVFELGHDGQDGIAYKRMPIFDTQQQVEHYTGIYHEYNELLLNIGIDVPEYGSASIITDEGDIVFFVVQQKLMPESLGNKIIHSVPDDMVLRLVLQVLRKLKKVWDFNGTGTGIKIGIDGQISNWAVKNFDCGNPAITDQTGLFYIDTSTPLIRKQGVEMLESELLLKSTPSFLRWMVKWFFLQEVLDRYYDFRLVVMDLIANFYKEGRKDMVPGLIGLANKFFDEEANRHTIKPIEYKEVAAYYKNDAFIWTLFQKLRRFDRFLKTKVFMGRYPYILPEYIKR